MPRLNKPSPAVSFVGRHNSGKTTLICQVISELVARGLDVGSIKHHGHVGFDIDIPGKDSYRHRVAGSRDVVVVSPDRIARITELDHEVDCDEIVQTMFNHDIVIVEGFRSSGLPVIEVMRQENQRDQAALQELLETGRIRGAMPLGFATDMPQVHEYAAHNGLVHFDINDVAGIADFLQERFVRPRITVVIQAGGESRRMGQSKALVPFLGQPLIARLVRRLSPAADEIVITTNEAEKLGFVHDLGVECPIRLVGDVFEKRGALRGICTAFEASSSPITALVACDMVFASPEVVIAEAYKLHTGGADAVVPRNSNGVEPFHGVYRTDRCLWAVREALAEGNERAKDFFDKVDMDYFEGDEVVRAAPAGGCFINTNTPEELARAQRLILEEGDR